MNYTTKLFRYFFFFCCWGEQIVVCFALVRYRLEALGFSLSDTTRKRTEHVREVGTSSSLGNHTLEKQKKPHDVVSSVVIIITIIIIIICGRDTDNNNNARSAHLLSVSCLVSHSFLFRLFYQSIIYIRLTTQPYVARLLRINFERLVKLYRKWAGKDTKQRKNQEEFFFVFVFLCFVSFFRTLRSSLKNVLYNSAQGVRLSSTNGSYNSGRGETNDI